MANRTEATFIRVIGSELVQKYVGEGARMVRSLFVSVRMARGVPLLIPLLGNGAEQEGMHHLL